MKRKYNDGMTTKHQNHSSETGAVTISVIIAGVLGIFTIAFAGLAIWAYMNYSDQKTTVDNKVALAVADAKKSQADEDETKYTQLLQNPYTEFVGPDDLGRLTFNYPKTWSAYVNKDGSDDSYEAYLNPVTVPPVSAKQQFAIRITINSKDYDQVLDSYASLIKKGSLKSSTTSADGQNGTRLDGNFTKDIRGAAVIYKVRDKTLTIRTDADTFKPEFEKLIKTIKFNT